MRSMKMNEICREKRTWNRKIKNVILSETGRCGSGLHTGTQEKSLREQETNQATVLLSDQLGDHFKREEAPAGVGCCREVGLDKAQEVITRGEPIERPQLVRCI